MAINCYEAITRKYALSPWHYGRDFIWRLANINPMFSDYKYQCPACKQNGVYIDIDSDSFVCNLCKVTGDSFLFVALTYDKNPIEILDDCLYCDEQEFNRKTMKWSQAIIDDAEKRGSKFKENRSKLNEISNQRDPDMHEFIDIPRSNL